MQGYEGNSTLGVYSDEEIRERDGRPATPPPRGQIVQVVDLPLCAPLPREIVEERAIETRETLPPCYPRTQVVSESTLLSLRLRQFSRDLDLLAASAPSFEPGTLRRKLNAIRAQLALAFEVAS